MNFNIGDQVQLINGSGPVMRVSELGCNGKGEVRCYWLDAAQHHEEDFFNPETLQAYKPFVPQVYSLPSRGW